MIWYVYAWIAAILGGCVAGLLKLGNRKSGYKLAAGIWSLAIMFLACGLVRYLGVGSGISSIGSRSWIFLIFSGAALGGSWICLCHALECGEALKITPIGRITLVTIILVSRWLFGDGIRIDQYVAIIFVIIGAVLMITKSNGRDGGYVWLWQGLLAGGFYCLARILTRYGVSGVNTYLSWGIQIVIATIVIWIIVLVTGGHHNFKAVSFLEGIFLCLSALAAAGAFWFYYHCKITGSNYILALILQLSIVFSSIFSCLFLREKMTTKALIGLVLLVIGLLLLQMETSIFTLLFTKI